LLETFQSRFGFQPGMNLSVAVRKSPQVAKLRSPLVAS